jgi:hypothetical protein
MSKLGFTATLFIGCLIGAGVTYALLNKGLSNERIELNKPEVQNIVVPSAITASSEVLGVSEKSKSEKNEQSQQTDTFLLNLKPEVISEPAPLAEVKEDVTIYRDSNSDESTRKKHSIVPESTSLAVIKESVSVNEPSKIAKPILKLKKVPSSMLLEDLPQIRVLNLELAELTPKSVDKIGVSRVHLALLKAKKNSETLIANSFNVNQVENLTMSVMDNALPVELPFQPVDSYSDHVLSDSQSDSDGFVELSSQSNFVVDSQIGIDFDKTGMVSIFDGKQITSSPAKMEPPKPEALPKSETNKQAVSTSSVKPKAKSSVNLVSAVKNFFSFKTAKKVKAEIPFVPVSQMNLHKMYRFEPVTVLPDYKLIKSQVMEKLGINSFFGQRINQDSYGNKYRWRVHSVDKYMGFQNDDEAKADVVIGNVTDLNPVVWVKTPVNWSKFGGKIVLSLDIENGSRRFSGAFLIMFDDWYWSWDTELDNQLSGQQLDGLL